MTVLMWLNRINTVETRTGYSPTGTKHTHFRAGADYI